MDIFVFVINLQEKQIKKKKNYLKCFASKINYVIFVTLLAIKMPILLLFFGCNPLFCSWSTNNPIPLFFSFFGPWWGSNSTERYSNSFLTLWGTLHGAFILWDAIQKSFLNLRRKFNLILTHAGSFNTAGP